MRTSLLTALTRSWWDSNQAHWFLVVTALTSWFLAPESVRFREMLLLWTAELDLVAEWSLMKTAIKVSSNGVSMSAHKLWQLYTIAGITGLYHGMMVMAPLSMMATLTGWRYSECCSDVGSLTAEGPVTPLMSTPVAEYWPNGPARIFSLHWESWGKTRSCLHLSCY